jgi:putative heme iron utilization protein
MAERRNADIVRLLIRKRGVGTLATNMAEGGAPYASLVTYACDHGAQPIFLFSTLSDHTKNLLKDGNASLLVEDTSRRQNPQTGPRVSLMGKIKRVKSPDLRARFLARHPEASLYEGFGDFGFFRMTVERAHYVGGFARAIWFEAKHILTPSKVAKEISEMEAGVVAHMNSDHLDAIQACASSLAGRKPGDWKMIGCDSDGVDLRADGRFARVEFHNTVIDSKTCRETLIKMAEEARSQK